MESATEVQIINESLCIALRSNALWKSMNLRQPVQEKENSEFKQVLPCLENDLVSHPVRDGGDG